MKEHHAQVLIQFYSNSSFVILSNSTINPGVKLFTSEHKGSRLLATFH